MDEKRLAGERLLGSWLNLSSTVWNRRRVSGMTFNEVLVCGLLKRRKDTEPDKFYIATELCVETGLFKSPDETSSSIPWRKRGLLPVCAPKKTEDSYI